MRTKKRYFIFSVIVLFLLAGCTETKKKGAANENNDWNETHGITREECEKQGGVWRAFGLFPEPVCNFKMNDAGKECTDSARCTGICITEKKDAQTGRCSELKTPIGCFAEVRNGTAGNMVCREGFLLK